MIKYTLKCDQEHDFDSWFSSGDDYDRLTKAGLVSCAVCGSTVVEKALMAPSVGKSATPEPASLGAPASVAEQALAELRRTIEANTENVGTRFVAEARKIHHGEAPERAIIGEARPQEAIALIDEGIQIAALPWSNRKAN